MRARIFYVLSVVEAGAGVALLFMGWARHDTPALVVGAFFWLDYRFDVIDRELARWRRV